MSAEATVGRSSSVVSGLGWWCLAAGIVGAASAVFLVLVDPVVGPDRYGYPLSPAGFTAIQVFFFVHHFGLLAGLYGSWRSGAVGASRAGRWGMWGAIVGMGLLTVTELVAITAADAPYPSPRTDLIDALYGVSSVLIGVTLVVAGVAVLHARRWHGWPRFVPLALGLYVFVPMTPAMLISHDVARFAIGGWMVGFALLGWALVAGTDRVVEARPAGPR